MKVEQLAQILEPRLPERNPVVITSGPLLGLGDVAVWSTLPERFTKLGYDVYYDKDNAASNPEIFELFWEKNPFIKGPSDLKPNAGYGANGEIQGRFYEIANRLRGHRSIEAMERAHGLPPDPDTGRYGMAPRVYYQPKSHPLAESLKDAVLVDFSAVSSKLTKGHIIEHVKMMSGAYRNPSYIQVLHPPWIVVNQERVVESAYAVTSIYEYLDMLHLCRAWVGSEAGGQSLAAAVRGEHDVYEENVRPEVVSVITKQTLNSRGYTYRTNDYRATSPGIDPDYHSPIEVEALKYANMCAVRKYAMPARRQVPAHG